MQRTNGADSTEQKGADNGLRKTERPAVASIAEGKNTGACGNANKNKHSNVVQT